MSPNRWHRIGLRSLGILTPAITLSDGGQLRQSERSAESIAGLLGVDPDEVIFTSGATEANNLALLGLSHGDAPSGSQDASW